MMNFHTISLLKKYKITLVAVTMSFHATVRDEPKILNLGVGGGGGCPTLLKLECHTELQSINMRGGTRQLSCRLCLLLLNSSRTRRTEVHKHNHSKYIIFTTSQFLNTFKSSTKYIHQKRTTKTPAKTSTPAKRQNGDTRKQ